LKALSSEKSLSILIEALKR